VNVVVAQAILVSLFAFLLFKFFISQEFISSLKQINKILGSGVSEFCLRSIITLDNRFDSTFWLDSHQPVVTTFKSFGSRTWLLHPLLFLSSLFLQLVFMPESKFWLSSNCYWGWLLMWSLVQFLVFGYFIQRLTNSTFINFTHNNLFYFHNLCFSFLLFIFLTVSSSLLLVFSLQLANKSVYVKKNHCNCNFQ